MEEGVTYADLRLPPVPAPPQPVRLPWHWAALSLGVLSLLLLLVQIVLVGLSFHYLAQQASCAQREEESLRYVQQSLRESCHFCPAGWIGDAGRCYYFSSAKKNWEQSKDDCCSRGAQLVTVRTNSTLAFLARVTHLDIFHVGLKRDSSRFEWKWLDGTLLKGRLPLQRSSSSYVACGRVSGSGLSAGSCGEAHGWVCEKSAVTLQWLRSSIPAFLWGNTTYTCVGP